MPNCFLASLAKAKRILKLKDLVEFLEPWHGVNKYANEIFQYLKMNCPSSNTNIADAKPLLQLLSKAK